MNTIYDFETMSQDPVNGVVVSFAMLNFDPKRFTTNPYTYHELVDNAKFMKFDVVDQVMNYGRTICKETVAWWGKQSKEAQAAIAPNAAVDRPISELYSFYKENMPDYPRLTYTRRNTFDPVFMTSLMKATGNSEPYAWWDVRDTISYIEGLAITGDIKNNFVPDDLVEHFVAHDPRHDIAMDVMRLQILVDAVTSF